MTATAKDLLADIQETIAKYGEDSPVMWVYFDRGTIQEEYDLLSENKEFVIKPLTDEAVAEVFEELIFECDDFYDALTEVMVDKFVE